MQNTYLFVSPQYLPTAGGVERFTNQLSLRLLALGHRVVVATSALPGLADHEICPDGVEVYRFPSRLFMNGRFPVIRPGKAFSALSREFWAIPFDFCVINTYFYPMCLWASREIRKRKIPCIVINHGSQWLMTGSLPLRLAGQIYERCAAWYVSRNCPGFFGVSQAARDWMRTFHIVPRGIITNAIDPDQVIAAADSDISWKQQLNLPESSKIIAFIGRMIPEKGVEPLVKAMEQIRKEVPGAVLVLAGAGPLEDLCRQKSREGIFSVGVQPYEKVLALLQQADLFCLPSRSEGFACTVLEAAALGCPIVTTATGGSPQLLISPDYGTLLPSMEPDDIAAACIQALQDPAWRETARRLAGLRLRENYTWDCALRQLLKAFENS